MFFTIQNLFSFFFLLMHVSSNRFLKVVKKIFKLGKYKLEYCLTSSFAFWALSISPRMFALHKYKVTNLQNLTFLACLCSSQSFFKILLLKKMKNIGLFGKWPCADSIHGVSTSTTSYHKEYKIT